MIGLAVSRVIYNPAPRVWPNERIFEAAGGAWKIKFHDSVEWHMGADGWRATLLCGNKDVSADHRVFESLRTERGFHLPNNYRPWCNRNPVLALHPWDSTLYLYRVDERRSRSKKLASFPLEIQWAPNGELIAVTHDGHVRLLEVDGADVVDIAIRHPQADYPEAFWWPDGQRLFVIHRESRTAKTRLVLFDPTDGKILDAADLDPVDLLPYDTAAYARIDRDRYALRLGRGARCVGYLLDKWSRVEFDMERLLLRATVYRPVGNCELRDGEYTCDAEARGVELTISA